jgi:hypothetical protein
METQGIDNPLVAKRNPILRGYAAFNDGRWDILEELLSPTVKWHGMHGEYFDNRDDVITHLKDLRLTNEAEFLGMTIKDNAAVTLDYTYSSSEGDHGCADRILFDGQGLITEVWHCKAATHDEDHHPEH